MILPTFNDEILKGSLLKLDNSRRLIFGALCCERILPNYVAFQADAKWGDIGPIREALNLVWSHLSGRMSGLEEVKRNITSCEFVAPSSEDFDSLYVTSAQDACFAVCALLDYLLEPDVNKIVQVATYATDSVDLYVQEIEKMDPADPELEKKILNHSLMQRELSQQNKDLATITDAHSLDEGFLSKIKFSWNNNGKSNLDIP